jgi:hypothetical protein
MQIITRSPLRPVTLEPAPLEMTIGFRADAYPSIYIPVAISSREVLVPVLHLSGGPESALAATSPLATLLKRSALISLATVSMVKENTNVNYANLDLCTKLTLNSTF